MHSKRPLVKWRLEFAAGIVRIMQWFLGMMALIFVIGAGIPPYTVHNVHWLMFGAALYYGWLVLTIYRIIRSKP